MLTLLRVIESVTGASGRIIAWVVFPLILASCYEVFSRYLMNAPTIWAFELGYMAMGTHALVGAAYALRERAHIRIDVLYSLFPVKVRAILDTAGYLLLFMPVVFWLTFGLWEYWVEDFQSGVHSGQSAWNPIIWPFHFMFFLGFFLLSLQGIAEFIKCVRFLTGQTDEWEPRDG